MKTPTRKPRGGELTEGQKAENQRVARRRAVAEHGIGKMKVWWVAAERYRNPVGRHTLIMKNVAGLHNLMVAWPTIRPGSAQLQTDNRLLCRDSTVCDPSRRPCRW